MMEENIAEITTQNKEPIIIVGGDLNRNDPKRIATILPELKVLTTGPTRGISTLEDVVTNAEVNGVELTLPLENRQGIRSDHLPIKCQIPVPCKHVFEKREVIYRPVTEKGKESFSDPHLPC